MNDATVVIPHAFVTRWLQTSVATLKQHKNNATFDILVVDNSIPHPSIKGIVETSLGEGVRVVPPQDPAHGGHQMALDHAIDLVDTPWFVAWETDVRVMRDGWLDWLLSFIKDDYVAIVGWYWSIGIDDNRHYISPAGALYRTSVLKRLKRECLNNKDLAVCWGRDMSKRIDLAKEYPNTAGKFIAEENWGPFVECRGFGNVYPFPRDQWVPEPGNWIYNRCAMQWECIHVPGEMVPSEPSEAAIGLPHKYTYVGPSEKEAYFCHYWAGSVSHNFEKHKIPPWDAAKLPFWLGREHKIWNEVVPEDVRKKTLENGWAIPYDQEYAYAISRVTG